MTMRSARLVAIVLGTAAPAAHAGEIRMPIHGWLQVDVEAAPASGVVWAGVTLPVSADVGIAVDARGALDRAGVDVGPTVELGALALAPMVGAEWTFSGDPGLAAQLLGVVEAPPLPLYLETSLRFTIRSPLSDAGEDRWSMRNLGLWRLHRRFALGLEEDVVHTLGGPDGHHRLGPRANLGLGHGLTAGLFVGIELDPGARSSAPVAWLAGGATLDWAW